MLLDGRWKAFADGDALRRAAAGEELNFMLNSDIFNTLGVDPALILAILGVLVLILLIVVVVMLAKFHWLKNRYDLFMRGKNGRTLEDNIVEIYRKLQVMESRDLANKDIIKMLNRGMGSSLQKIGIVKYNAFQGMGGNSSFAITMLNMENTGFILDVMHSRNNCSMYLKEITHGEPEGPISKEEKESLDKALQTKKI